MSDEERDPNAARFGVGRVYDGGIWRGEAASVGIQGEQARRVEVQRPVKRIEGRNTGGRQAGQRLLEGDEGEAMRKK